MNTNKYQGSLNDIINNCEGFPCKNDSFYNMQELIDNRSIEYAKMLEKDKEIERLNNIIKEAKEYIQDYFYIDKETGEYYFTHTFDKCNVGELLEILGSDKE